MYVCIYVYSCIYTYIYVYVYVYRETGWRAPAHATQKYSRLRALPICAGLWPRTSSSASHVCPLASVAMPNIARGCARCAWCLYTRRGQTLRIIWGPGIGACSVGGVLFLKQADAEMCRPRHGAPPPQHGQTVRGLVVPVDCHTERDRGVSRRRSGPRYAGGAAQ